MRVLFEVRDTGIGIPEEAQAHIFEPFVQLMTHSGAGGAGLGLAITREYLHMLGTELELESTPGVGSCFHFELLLTCDDAGDQAEGAAPLSEPSRAGTALTGRRVLIVDDDPRSRELVTRLLEPLQPEIAVAGDGLAALSLAAAWRPDLIVMDWRMEGLNGLEAAQAIRKLDGLAAVKILMISANAFEEQVRDALGSGVDAFVRKPLQEARFMDAVRDLMAEASPPASASVR